MIILFRRWHYGVYSMMYAYIDLHVLSYAPVILSAIGTPTPSSPSNASKLQRPLVTYHRRGGRAGLVAPPNGSSHLAAPAGYGIMLHPNQSCRQGQGR